MRRLFAAWVGNRESRRDVAMNDMAVIRQVVLSEGHLRPGRTHHTISNGSSQADFPPFISLGIARYPGDAGFYLLRECTNGQVADTYHLTLEDAFHQAEFEFGVGVEEWVEAKNSTHL